MRAVVGDFVIDTTLDLSNSMTQAGGILIYQDDDTLIRLGCGIQADGEITFSVKSPFHGFVITARGLLLSDRVRLRLARRENNLAAFCSDGKKWYECGQIKLDMNDEIRAGLYAECTYRVFAADRCTTTPVRFSEVKLNIGGVINE